MYQRGLVSVVLHETTRTVITVLLRTGDVWQHDADTQRPFLAARARNAWSDHQAESFGPCRADGM